MLLAMYEPKQSTISYILKSSETGHYTSLELCSFLYFIRIQSRDLKKYHMVTWTGKIQLEQHRLSSELGEGAQEWTLTGVGAAGADIAVLLAIFLLDSIVWLREISCFSAQ